MWANPQLPADLVILTEEILNGKLYFFCNDNSSKQLNVTHNNPHKFKIKFVAIHKNQTNNQN